MKTLNYSILKSYVKSKGDRIQKSGMYFLILFDNTKINGRGIEVKVEEYLKEYEDFLILVKYNFDFMKSLEERKVGEAQFKLRSKFIKVV